MILLRIEAFSRERERERGVGPRFPIVHRIHGYDSIISVNNLLIAWREFLCGKRKRKDVEKFSINLSDNIVSLHHDLKSKTYRHSSYKAFKISDPKPRDIHKATVRDRLLHHAIYRILYPFFDRKFIYDSYSCRVDKGTHRAINRFRDFARIVSRNHTRTVWILKCDIRKFFASIDHKILKDILKKHIRDNDVNWLLKQVIDSFQTGGKLRVGLPLGNLTSQLLVNIYMNELDHFVKRELKCKYYIRYADDFVILHEDRKYLDNLIPSLSAFLETKLKILLHPGKLFVNTLASGVDFLGWVNFSNHRVLRTATKRRMFRAVREKNRKEGSLQSYLGLLRHGNAIKIKKSLVEVVKE